MAYFTSIAHHAIALRAQMKKHRGYTRETIGGGTVIQPECTIRLTPDTEILNAVQQRI